MGRKEKTYFLTWCDPDFIFFFQSSQHSGMLHRVKNQFFLSVPMPSVRLHEQYSADTVPLYLSVMWSKLILRSSFRPSSSLLVLWRCCPLLQLPEPGDTGSKTRSRYFILVLKLSLWDSGSSSFTVPPRPQTTPNMMLFKKYSHIISVITADHLSLTISILWHVREKLSKRLHVFKTLGLEHPGGVLI